MRRTHLIRSGAFVLIVFAGLAIILIPLERGIRVELGRKAREAQKAFAQRTGLSLGYESVSPSILRGLSLSGIEIRAKDGSLLFAARHVAVRYDFFSLVSGKGLDSLTAIEASGVSAFLSPEGIHALKVALSSLGGSSSTGSVRQLPALSLKVERLHLELNGYIAGGLAVDVTSFRYERGANDAMARLDAEARVSTPAAPGVGQLELPLSAHGLIAANLSSASVALDLAMRSSGMSVRRTPLVLGFSNGALELAIAGAHPELAATLRYAPSDESLSADVKLDRLVPGRFVSMAAGGDMESALALSLSGLVSLRLPLEKLGQSTFSVNLEGRGSEYGMRFALEASGDLSRIRVSKAMAEGGFGALAFAGDVGLADASVEGDIALSLSLAAHKLPLSASLSLGGRAGEYRISSPAVELSGQSLGPFTLKLFREKRGYGYSLALGDGVGQGLPELSGRGSLTLPAGGGKANLSGQLLFDSFSMASLESAIGTLSHAGLSGRLAPLGLSGKLAIFTDFSSFRYSTEDLRLIAADASSYGAKGPASLAIRAAGSEKGFSLESADLSAGDYKARLSGSAAFAPLSFSAELDLAGERYALSGRSELGILHVDGDYGLALDAHRAGGEVLVHASAAKLPIPIAAEPLLASFNVDASFVDGASWKVLLSSLSLVPSRPIALAPRLELSAELGPGEGRLVNIVYGDSVSRLEGSGSLSYPKADGSYEPKLSARLSNPAGESYEVEASYSDATFDLAATIRSSPLARLIQGPVSGGFDGRLALHGKADAIAGTYSLGLVGSTLLGKECEASLSGGISSTGCSVASGRLAWQGMRADGLSGKVDFSSGAISLGGRFATEIDGAPLSCDFSAAGAPTASRDFKIAGSLSAFAYRAYSQASWPFIATLSKSGLAFDGGGGGELSASYRNDGSFSLVAKRPFPMSISLAGSFTGSRVKAVATGIDVDLAFLMSLWGPVALSIDKGRISGDLAVEGEVTDPSMKGTLMLEGFICRLPGWVASSIGPLSAPIDVEGKRLSLSVGGVPAGAARLKVEAEAYLEGWFPGDVKGSVVTENGQPFAYNARVRGLSGKGLATADISFLYGGGQASIKGDVTILKSDIVINPQGFWKHGAWSQPSTVIDVDLNLACGPGVRFFFPSTEIPVVVGYADRSTLIHVAYSEETGDYSIKGIAYLRGGDVYYVQKDFYLKNAKIVFNETQDSVDPLLTLVAEKRVRSTDGTVLLRVSADNAPLFELQPKLSSDPIMSAGEIAALLGVDLVDTDGDGVSLSLVKAAIAGSSFIPQLDVVNAFQTKIRDALGLDIVFIQSKVVQRWLAGVSGLSSSEESRGLAYYLDGSYVYAGKYLGDAVFLHGAIGLDRDPLVPSGLLRLDSDFGVEFDAPFGTLTWDLAPKSPENLFISDQSIGLSWKVKL
jgi:hypothetical protein